MFRLQSIIRFSFCIFVSAIIAFFCAGCGDDSSDDNSLLALLLLSGGEYGLPAEGATAQINVNGAELSNGMYSLWKVNKHYDNYFSELEDETEEISNAYFLFSETRCYYLEQYKTDGNYYLLFDSNETSKYYQADYTYNSSTGEITLQNMINAYFSAAGDSAFLGFFASVDEFDYHLLTLQKADSLSATVEGVSENTLIQIMQIIELTELQQGDGSSANGINVAVNYTGGKTVSDTSPVSVYIIDAANQDGQGITHKDAVAGGGLFSNSGTLNITGLPDGDYKALAFVRDDFFYDNDLMSGDSHLFYGGAYFETVWQRTGTETTISLSGGQTTDIAIAFDDTHLFPEMTEHITKLNSVSASYDSGSKVLTITVDVDTSGLGSGNVANQYIHALLLSPSSYHVNGVIETENGWSRGQSMFISLSHSSGTTWSIAYTVQDYQESGVWWLNYFQTGDNNGTASNMSDDELVRYESEWHGDFASTYQCYTDYNYSFLTSIPVVDVEITTSAPDITGPSLTGISVDNSTITSSETATITVTMTDSGGSGVATDVGACIGSLNHADGSSMTFITCQADGSYQGTVSGASISAGVLTIGWVIINDNAGNRSNYHIYNEPEYSGNPFGLNDTNYYLFNFGIDLPTATEVEKITITRE